MTNCQQQGLIAFTSIFQQQVQVSKQFIITRVTAPFTLDLLQVETETKRDNKKNPATT